MNKKEREELLKKIEEYTEKIKKDPDNDTYYYNRGSSHKIRDIFWFTVNSNNHIIFST